MTLLLRNGVHDGPIQAGGGGQICRAMEQSTKSRYLACTVVYLVYAAAMVLVPDYFMNSDLNILNNVYIVFGALHLINACMYVWSWEHRGWEDPVLWPEYLNVLGALLYLLASFLYGSNDDLASTPSTLFLIERWLELVASFIEMIASVGWVFVWVHEFNESVLANSGRPIPGRGWTLDDPDIWANASIICAAVIYLTYNCRVLIDLDLYRNDDLYRTGDRWYLCNAMFYLLAATRDCGWFWFMPTFGILPPAGCALSSEAHADRASCGELGSLGSDPDEEDSRRLLTYQDTRIGGDDEAESGLLEAVTVARGVHAMAHQGKGEADSRRRSSSSSSGAWVPLVALPSGNMHPSHTPFE